MRHPMAVLLCLASVAALAPVPARASARSPVAAAPTENARVHIGPADGGTDAFVAWPGGATAVPAVIVVHEWWGLNGQIREIARRLARQGYAAIVPDLYHGKVADNPEQAHELVRGLEDTRVMSELDAAAAWLRSQPRTARSRIGVMGFCVGGGLTLKYALHSSEPAAAVMFYGPPETDPEKLASLKTALMGHFGAEDQGIAASRVEEFKAALQKAGKPAEIYLYPGAGHAFMHEGRPSYHPDAARQAWARTLAFLQKRLKG